MFFFNNSKKIIRFLENKSPQSNGFYLQDILSFSDDELEKIHNYIQWCFPLPKKSFYNPLAPSLSKKDIAYIKESELIKNNLLSIFCKMMRFYGLIITEESYGFSKDINDMHWLNKNNHNYLRLTRILISLNLLGFTSLSISLFNSLAAIYKATPDKIGEKTMHFWKNAIDDSFIKNNNTYVINNSKSINVLIFADTHDSLVENEDFYLKISKPFDVCILLGDHSYNDLQIITRHINPNKIIGILGNHDNKDLLKAFNIININNELIYINNVSFIGVEGCIKYKNCSPGYTLEEGAQLVKNMPYADVLISHALPQNIDMKYITQQSTVHSGSVFLNNYIYQKNIPIILSGHNHSNFSVKMKNGTTVYENFGVQHLELSL